MTRKGFFQGALALFGVWVAKAQKFECGNEPGGIKCPKELPKLYITRSMAWFSPPQAAIDVIPNGTCPVCFTKVEAIYHHKQDTSTYRGCPGEETKLSTVVCVDASFKEIKFENVIRCKHCSASFYQDSEPNPK